MSALVSGQELGQMIAKTYLHLCRKKKLKNKNKERKEILNS